MTEERKNGKNAVQATHHKGLLSNEEMQRIINTSTEGLGYNDLSAALTRRWVNNGVTPSAVGPLNNAIKYILSRLGAKDDTRVEIEKSIWYLMDAHNRISDEEGEDRQFAPWRSIGKLEKLRTEPSVEDDYWRKVENPFVTFNALNDLNWEARCKDRFNLGEGYLNPTKFKAGDYVYTTINDNRVESNRAYKLIELDSNFEEGTIGTILSLDLDDGLGGYYYFSHAWGSEEDKKVEIYKLLE